MLRSFLCFLYCLFAYSGFSQNSQDLPIELKNCNVQVDANSFTATTIILMEFYNPNNKVMDGQYDFALQQGQVITGFALDINGKLRDGVIVDKKKGRVAYENTIRRRIDPGLLEMTSGNNYRVRIYPMPAKGSRNIKIVISQVLIAKQDALQYYLPFNSTAPVTDFTVAVRVTGSQYTPVVDQGMLEGKSFIKENQSFSINSKKQNTIPGKPLSFQVPFGGNTTIAYSDSDKLFALRLKLPKKQQADMSIKSATVFWDVSASAKRRNIKKELSFLEKFIKDKKPGELKIITFSNSVHAVRNFTQPSGTTVGKFLEEQQLDGGTQLGALDCSLYNTDLFLLFSDGLSNTGKSEMSTAGKTIFTINSSPVANHTVLQQLAQKTGGKYIDLNISNSKDAVAGMFESGTQLLAVSQGGRVLQHSLSLPFSAGEYLTISGMSVDKSKDIELVFGNSGSSTFSEKINIFSAENKNNELLDEMYLLQKFDAIQSGFTDEALINDFAQNAEFVTATTSFIVLDNVDDYIEHGIVPPHDLMEEYSKKRTIVDQKAKALLASKENEEINNLRKAAGLYNDRIRWWGATESLIDPAKLSLPKNELIVQHGTFSGNKTSGNDPYAAAMFKGSGALEEVVVTALGIQRQRRSLTGSVTVVRGEDINFSGATSLANALQGRVAGLTVITSGIPGTADKIMLRGFAIGPANAEPLYILDDMPVDAETANTISPASIESVAVLKGTQAAARYGSGAGNGVIVIQTKRGNNSKYEKGISRYKDLEDIEYVTELKESGDAGAIYSRYLQMRNTHEDEIAFYADAAQVLFEAGDKKLALRVLSNLAEMDMENHQVLRGMGYILESWKMYDEAIEVYKKVLAIKEEEPQSYRDLALAYDRNGQYEQAVDILYKIITKNFYQYEDRYRGIKSLLLNEMNAIINRHPGLNCLQKITTAIIKPLPVDLRVVIDWNKDETDIDLHIAEPGGEKCFYGYKQTKAGGRLSEDFTQGNGPEEYQVKNAVNGRYSIMVNYYGDRYQKQQVSPFVKLTIYKNFGKPDQSVHTEVFNLLNQSGIIEIGSVKF